MARKNHSQNGNRRDGALLKHFLEASETLSTVKTTIATMLTKRKVEEGSSLLTQAVEELERAEKSVCDLFDEGAT